MSTFYIGRMCGHRAHRHYDPSDQSHTQNDVVTVSDRQRQSAAEALGRSWAGGRMDVEEYEARVAQALAATTRDELTNALGDAGPVEPVAPPRGDGWRPRLNSPIGVAAALLAAVAVIAILAAATPLAFGFHPAFFWIVPLVGFKVAKFHGRRSWRRPDERTISV
jgi:hypothetical protein